MPSWAGTAISHFDTHAYEQIQNVAEAPLAWASVINERVNATHAHNGRRSVCARACVYADGLRHKRNATTHVASTVPCKVVEITAALEFPAPLERVLLAMLSGKFQTAAAPLGIPIKCTHLLVHFVTLLCQASAHGSGTNLL